MAQNGTFKGLAPALYRPVSAKTASYSIKPEDIGVLFTNRGASGAVVFTLPPNASIASGWFCEFFVVANQSFQVKSDTADTMVCFNDAAADSITFNTSNERIGAGVRCIWDGTGWLTFVHLGAETQTPTIAT